MTRSTTQMVNIYRIGLILLLIGFGSDSAHASASHLQTYVSTSGSLILQQEKSSSFFFAQQMEDSIKVGDVDSIKLKDSNKALLYAVIPGIVVHGAGHFYAGETTTGWVLVAGEVVSLSLAAYAIVVGIGESTNGSTSNSNAEIVGIFAGTLFITTWLSDIVGAPVAVQKYNEELIRKKTVSLKFDFDETTTLLRFQIVKRF